MLSLLLTLRQHYDAYERLLCLGKPIGTLLMFDLAVLAGRDNNQPQASSEAQSV